MKKNGFSFVEVLLAIVILSGTMILLLKTTGSITKNILDTRTTTQNLFKSVDATETTIKSIKQSVALNQIPTGYTASSITLFSGSDARTFSYYKLIKNMSTSTGHTSDVTVFLPSTVNTSADAPSISNLNVVINVKNSYGTRDVQAYYYNPSDRPQIKGSHDTPQPTTQNIKVVYQWYITKVPFYCEYNPEAISSDFGTNQPVFPADYTKIDGEDEINLKIIRPEYRGYALVLTATPITKAGYIGQLVCSRPVYLFGLPIFDGLTLHYDASNYRIIEPDGTALTKVKNYNGGGFTNGLISPYPGRTIFQRLVNLAGNGPPLICGRSGYWTPGQRYVETKKINLNIGSNVILETLSKGIINNCIDTHQHSSMDDVKFPPGIGANGLTIFVVAAPNDFSFDLSPLAVVNANDSEKYFRFWRNGLRYETTTLTAVGASVPRWVPQFYEAEIGTDGTVECSLNNKFAEKITVEPEDWTNATLRVGSSSSDVTDMTTMYHGWIWEIIIYNRVLSVPERKQVQKYLQDRYK